MEGSLADMKAYADHPDPPTDAMKFGTAVHAYLLQPDVFAKTTSSRQSSLARDR